MLYLEDFLELVEHLPEEVMDRLTEMRELDLQVENTLDKNKTRSTQLFQNGPNLTTDQLNAENDAIMNNYNKALNHSNEKIQIGNLLCDHVEKVIKNLDQELMKFSIDLEMDNPGITETIKKRVEAQLTNSDANSTTLKVNNPIGKNGARRGSRTRGKYTKINTANKQALTNGKSTVVSTPQITTPINQGAKTRRSTARSIEATPTQTVSSYGRVINSPMYARQTQPAPTTPVSKPRKPRKRGRQPRALKQELLIPKEEPVDEVLTYVEPDPNSQEAIYCTCSRIAFGDMVACDNKGCPYEWFHYECVGIIDTPKGNWYCSECTENMKKSARSSKKS